MRVLLRADVFWYYAAVGLASFQSTALGFSLLQSCVALRTASSDLAGSLKSLCLHAGGEMDWSLVIPEYLLLSQFPCRPSLRVIQTFPQRQRDFLSHAVSLRHLQAEEMFPLFSPFGCLYLTCYEGAGLSPGLSRVWSQSLAHRWASPALLYWLLRSVWPGEAQAKSESWESPREIMS